MKNSPKLKKLELNEETISRLSDNYMNGIHGAEGDSVSTGVCESIIVSTTVISAISAIYSVAHEASYVNCPPPTLPFTQNASDNIMNYPDGSTACLLDGVTINGAGTHP